MTVRERLPVDGVLLLDKPLGISSNLALQKARRLLRAAKAGHTGSLDPLATGLLPLCFGEATKFSSHLLHSHKRYLARVRLGTTTTTADAEGEVLEVRPVPDFTGAALEAVLDHFRGDILQVPPMYSALKFQGQRLYDLARRGVEVERLPRPVTIHALRLEAREGGDLLLDVHCSSGTYIRSLAEGIGRALGCGAHLAALRRTAAGDLELAGAVTLAELEAHPEAERWGLLQPPDALLPHLPEVSVGRELAASLRQGRAIVPAAVPAVGWVRLYERPGGFLGLGEVLGDGRVAPRRLLRTGAAETREQSALPMAVGAADGPPPSLPAGFP